MKDKKIPSGGPGSRPIIFGEVLFDTFPDGSSVLGGAPFNVAWHLKGFGLDPLFISRVGDDANGRLVTQSMLDWEMDISALQYDQQHQTGVVSIQLNNGQPTFSILPKQAYDYIDSEQACAQVDADSSAMLYYGSLINRGDVSSAALQALRQLDIPCYVDINLRQPWWNTALINGIVQGAKWLKLNDDELMQFDNGGSLPETAKALIEKYSLAWIIVTKGADGAFIATKDQVIESQPKHIENIKDTVGAGDAFSSVVLYGILNDWPLPTILQRAVNFAASICLQRGATVSDKLFYKSVLEEWQ